MKLNCKLKHSDRIQSVVLMSKLLKYKNFQHFIATESQNFSEDAGRSSVMLKKVIKSDSGGEFMMKMMVFIGPHLRQNEKNKHFIGLSTQHYSDYSIIRLPSERGLQHQPGALIK